jgi:hypothetical protein
MPLRVKSGPLLDEDLNGPKPGIARRAGKETAEQNEHAHERDWFYYSHFC